MRCLPVRYVRGACLSTGWGGVAAWDSGGSSSSRVSCPRPPPLCPRPIVPQVQPTMGRKWDTSKWSRDSVDSDSEAQ